MSASNLLCTVTTSVVKPGSNLPSVCQVWASRPRSSVSAVPETLTTFTSPALATRALRSAVSTAACTCASSSASVGVRRLAEPGVTGTCDSAPTFTVTLVPSYTSVNDVALIWLLP